MTSNDKADRPARLTAAHRVLDGVRVTTLRGEIDYDEKTALREALLPADEPVLPVVADMSGVTFLDSSGLNVLLTVHQQVNEAQGWLRVAAATDNVRRLLGLTGVDAVIPCHPTVEDALNA